MRTIHRDIVGTFIFSNDDHMLLGKSRTGGVYNGQWVIPGGGIEPGETKREAAIRETLEEVGIDITPFSIELLGATTRTGESEKILRDTGEKVLVKMTFYDFIVHANLPASKIPITCTDDIAEASWHHTSQLPSLALSPPIKSTLASLGYI